MQPQADAAVRPGPERHLPRAAGGGARRRAAGGARAGAAQGLHGATQQGELSSCASLNLLFIHFRLKCQQHRL